MGNWSLNVLKLIDRPPAWPAMLFYPFIYLCHHSRSLSLFSPVGRYPLFTHLEVVSPRRFFLFFKLRFYTVILPDSIPGCLIH